MTHAPPSGRLLIAAIGLRAVGRPSLRRNSEHSVQQRLVRDVGEKEDEETIVSISPTDLP